MKTQTAFRIDKTLLELVKEKAKSTNRSLNNYVEHVLYQDIGNIPNETTIKAIEDAQNGKNLEPITDLKSWLENI